MALSRSTSTPASTARPSFKKPTTFCGTPPGLHRIGRKCCCSEHLERLQGTVTLETEKGPKTIWRTSLASKYAPALCRILAQVVADAAPRSAFRADGEALIKPRWERDLAAALGKGDQPPADRVAPSCPLALHDRLGACHPLVGWPPRPARAPSGASCAPQLVPRPAASTTASPVTSGRTASARSPQHNYTVAMQEFGAWASLLGWRRGDLQELDTALDAYFESTSSTGPASLFGSGARLSTGFIGSAASTARTRVSCP